MRICKKSSTFAPDFGKSELKRLFVVFILVAGMVIGSLAEVLVKPDCPGEGVTSTAVLDRGSIQWETWLDVEHVADAHLITLPNTLFRFGLSPWAELRLEYSGSLVTWDHPEDLPGVAKVSYVPEPLAIGTKINLWNGSEDSRLRWIPRTAILANLRLPISYEYVNPSSAIYRPISGSMEVGFENDLADWLTIGYGVGSYWQEWAPTPDILASVCFVFQPMETFGFFVENYNWFDCDAIDITTGKQKTASAIFLDFGIMWFVHPRVQLHLNAGFSCYHSLPELSGPKNDVNVGLGVAWLLYRKK